MKASEIAELLPYLTDEERLELNALIAKDTAIWRPQPGPQSDAYTSTADVLGYGGAAGGGKTDLMCGTLLTRHRKGIIFRREATQLTGIIDRLTELLGSRDGYNGQDKIWRLPGRQIEFGSVPHLGDESKYQGRPHDFIGFDEATNFLEQQVRFLLGWLRTTVPNQRCRAILAFNPPTDAEGRWVIDYFAPWLDDKHPDPAKPGELRWFGNIDGKEVECEDGEPFTYKGKLIRPMSRTFIPSRVTDNPFLTATGYEGVLQSLPEPLRSQMLEGDFKAGMEDDPWQVIPTAWVDAAMARWEPKHARGPMDSMGLDVARGGRDATVCARRHGPWFDVPLRQPGAATPDGPSVAGFAISGRRDRAPVHVDVVGWGASAYDSLVANDVQAVAVNGASRTDERAKDGDLAFVNTRALLWWRMREALDPKNPEPIYLPNDPKLKADLCAPRWKLTVRGVQVEAKEEIIKRLGRSPDDGDAYCMALIATPKESADMYSFTVPNLGVA
jgi:hypothetical protein